MIAGRYDLRRDHASPAGSQRDMDAIEGHLEYLRLLGHSGATIYGRMTFLRVLSCQLPVPARAATKGRSERVIPLSAFAVAELVPVLPAAGWVFRRMDGRPGPNTPGLISHLANAHLHECGVAASLHQLRHRFATQAYQASRDLRAVQSMMGHTRPETTAGYAAFDQ